MKKVHCERINFSPMISQLLSHLTYSWLQDEDLLHFPTEDGKPGALVTRFLVLRSHILAPRLRGGLWLFAF